MPVICSLSQQLNRLSFRIGIPAKQRRSLKQFLLRCHSKLVLLVRVAQLGDLKGILAGGGRWGQDSDSKAIRASAFRNDRRWFGTNSAVGAIGHCQLLAVGIDYGYSNVDPLLLDDNVQKLARLHLHGRSEEHTSELQSRQY